MLHLVYADAELERVPVDLRDHPQVRAEARRRDADPSDLILDQSDHHAAMQDLPDGDRRGRPDIVHLGLLTVLESRAGKGGHVRPWVHARHDRWIAVDPETRLVKNTPRFVGLMRQLLREGRVGPKDRALLAVDDRSLADALADLPDPVVVLDADADPRPPRSWVAGLPDDATIVVGGFPSGTYRSTDALAGADRVALPGPALTAWAVAGEVVAQVASVRIDGLEVS